MKTLVLGLGNRLMTDDGFGPCAIDALAAAEAGNSGVTLLDGGTLGLDLLPALAEADRLIVIDALDSGGRPGEIVRLEGEEVPRAFATKLSIHQAGLKDLLAVAELTGDLPAEVVVWGAQPASLELGLELTPALAAVVPEVTDLVMRELARG